MELPEIIGENLRVIMAAKRYRIVDVVNGTSLSRGTLMHLRSGEFKDTGIMTLEKLAKFLDVGIDQLIIERQRKSNGWRYH